MKNRNMPGVGRHGIRDLNGPKLDGKYNGRNQCFHLRTETSVELRPVEGSKKIRSEKIERCKECGCEVDFTMREVKQEEPSLALSHNDLGGEA